MYGGFFYPLMEINVAHRFMLLRGKMREKNMHLQPLKVLRGQDLKNGVYLK